MPCLHRLERNMTLKGLLSCHARPPRLQPGDSCPVGSQDPVACLPGTYNPLLGADQCTECPAG